jgi:hypothetical protein
MRMKKMWQTAKLGEISLFIIAIIFAFLFYISGQYWISFATLSLLVISLRIKDLKTFAVGLKDGLKMDFSKQVEEVNEKMSELIKSPKTPEEKIEESQELLNKVFELGHLAGAGKPINMVSDVKIVYDENGKITGAQYTYT